MHAWTLCDQIWQKGTYSFSTFASLRVPNYFVDGLLQWYLHTTQNHHSRIVSENSKGISMVQLSSRVTPDRLCTHFRHVLHVFWTHPCLAKKGVVLMYVLLQLYHEVLRFSCAFRKHIARISDASYTHFRHVSHTFQMHSNVTLELSCTVLEL